MAPATARHAFLAGLAAPLLALAWPLPEALHVDLAAHGAGLGAVGAWLAATAVALGLAAAGLAMAAITAITGRAPGERAGGDPVAREGLGFLAAAAALWLLYRLAREARPEAIAALELAFLAAALLAWVRRLGSR